MSAAPDIAAAAPDSTPAAPQAAPPLPSRGALPCTLPPPALSRLLADPAMRGRGNGPVRQAALLQLQRTHGNRAVQRRLAGPPPPPPGALLGPRITIQRMAPQEVRMGLAVETQDGVLALVDRLVSAEQGWELQPMDGTLPIHRLPAQFNLLDPVAASILTNVNPPLPLARILPLYTLGSAFVGVYNPVSGQWAAKAGLGAALRYVQPLHTLGDRNGAHPYARDILQPPQEDRPKLVGFTLIWQGQNTFQLTWKSNLINYRNFGTAEAPPEYRDAVRAAIQQATGCQCEG